MNPIDKLVSFVSPKLGVERARLRAQEKVIKKQKEATTEQPKHVEATGGQIRAPRIKIQIFSDRLLI